MKNKYVWNVMIWKTNGDEVFKVFVQRPDFANIYPLKSQLNDKELNLYSLFLFLNGLNLLGHY